MEVAPPPLAAVGRFRYLGIIRPLNIFGSMEFLVGGGPAASGGGGRLRYLSIAGQLNLMVLYGDSGKPSRPPVMRNTIVIMFSTAGKPLTLEYSALDNGA